MGIWYGAVGICEAFGEQVMLYEEKQRLLLYGLLLEDVIKRVHRP